MPARVSRTTLLYAAIIFAAAPFLTALLRVVRTGYDWRYVCVALAAFAGAVAVMWIGKAPSQTKTVVRRLDCSVSRVYAACGVDGAAARRTRGDQHCFGGNCLRGFL